MFEEGASAATLGGVDTTAIDRVEEGVALVRGRVEMLAEVVVRVAMHVLVEGLGELEHRRRTLMHW